MLLFNVVASLGETRAPVALPPPCGHSRQRRVQPILQRSAFACAAGLRITSLDALVDGRSYGLPRHARVCPLTACCLASLPSLRLVYICMRANR